MISQCRPPRPTTFLTTHYRPTNMDFVGFSFFIHALLGVPILNLQSFLYPSELTHCVKISRFYHVLNIQNITANFLFPKQQHIDLQNKHAKGYT